MVASIVKPYLIGISLIIFTFISFAGKWKNHHYLLLSACSMGWNIICFHLDFHKHSGLSNNHAGNLSYFDRAFLKNCPTYTIIPFFVILFLNHYLKKLKSQSYHTRFDFFFEYQKAKLIFLILSYQKEHMAEFFWRKHINTLDLLDSLEWGL